MTGRHRRVGAASLVRFLLTLLATSALTFALIALVIRVQPVRSIPRLVVSVGATFVPLIALLGLLFAVLSRRLFLALFGVFMVTATLAIQVSWYYVGQPAAIGRSHNVRVLSSNLRYGEAEASSFVSTAEEGADVITVSELTPEAVQGFKQAGIERTFPYSTLIPTPGPGGMGIWSRYPLTPVKAAKHKGVLIPAARIQIPGIENRPLIASVHVHSPLASRANRLDEWSTGMASAKAQLDNFAREAGPAAVIIGGDYNSTPDMRQFRDLLTNGYHDAVEQTGAGFAPTFKADSWLPPLITIDHILTRNAAASSIKTIKIKGTDHRALLANVRVPLNPGS